MSSISNSFTSKLDELIQNGSDKEIIDYLEMGYKKDLLSDLQKLLFGVLLFVTVHGDTAYAHEVFKESLKGSKSLEAAIWLAHLYTSLYPVDPCFVEILHNHNDNGLAQYMLG